MKWLPQGASLSGVVHEMAPPGSKPEWSRLVEFGGLSLAELTPRQIQRVVTKTALHAPNRDSLYWCAQPYQARLAQLESIRQQYHLWKYGAEPGFQRVYTVVKR